MGVVARMALTDDVLVDREGVIHRHPCPQAQGELRPLRPDDDPDWMDEVCRSCWPSKPEEEDADA